MRKLIVLSVFILLILMLHACTLPTKRMNTLPTSFSESIKDVPPVLITPNLKNPRVLTAKEVFRLVTGSTGYWARYKKSKKVKYVSANYFSPDGRIEILEDLRSRYMLPPRKKSFHRDNARWGIKENILYYGMYSSKKKIHYSPLVLVTSDSLPRDQFYVFLVKEEKPKHLGIISFKASDTEKDLRLKSTCMLARNPPNIQCCSGTPEFSNWLKSSECKAIARGWERNSVDAADQFKEGVEQIFSGQFPVTPNILKKSICGAYGGNC